MTATTTATATATVITYVRNHAPVFDELGYVFCSFPKTKQNYYCCHARVVVNLLASTCCVYRQECQRVPCTYLRYLLKMKLGTPVLTYRDLSLTDHDVFNKTMADINRQLEQMVMSEEFERELEDEINQVKELEHANRRFKVKIDMLEREKNTISKKYDAKLEFAENKVQSLEEQISEWETQASGLEAENRKKEEEWDTKLVEEQERVREMQEQLRENKGALETERKNTEAKVDEYETVLGKLMERNEELEGEVVAAQDEADVARRQLELAERRRSDLGGDHRQSVKIKELEAKVEEQRIMIEQQQEVRHPIAVM